MGMDNTEDYYFGRCYLVNDQPAEANSFSVNFIPGGDFFAFAKGERVLQDTIYRLINLITYTNGI